MRRAIFGQRSLDPHLAVLLGVLLFAVFAATCLQLSLWRSDLPPEAVWQPWPFAANVLLLAGYGAFWLLVTPRPAAAAAGATVGVGVVALANFYKVSELAEPLMLFDVFQVSNAPVLFHYVPASDLALALAGALLLVIPLLRARTARPRAASILALELVLVGFAVLLGRGLATDGETWAKRTFATVDVFWHPLAHYTANGFVVAMLLDLPQVAITIPEHYEAGHERRVLSSYLGCESDAAPAAKRHVVVTMLESFWDPTSDGFAFDRDPLPTYRRLRERGSVQHFVSPVFGSRTANAEFEVLTGLSTRFSPIGSIPYQQYVKRPIESLATIFHHAGYRTVAIHNFRRSFWNRDAVYPKLGFDEYIALEDLGDVPWELGWPSDAALFERVERILEDSDRPTFVFAVTVATHGPYSGHGLEATVRYLDAARPDLVEPLSIYASKLALLDRHFGEFVARLDRTSVPPLVVAFGDHLPSVAAQALPAGNAEQAPFPRSRLVEALILDPGGPGSAVATRSLNCLGPQVLRLAGISPSPFFRFVEALCTSSPVVTPSVSLGGDPALEDYRWLTYDRLFGESYSSAACDPT